jgi:hypothetical protein
LWMNEKFWNGREKMEGLELGINQHWLKLGVELFI